MPDLLQLLTEIPDLAVEAWITRDAPNPGAVAARHSRQEAPKAPVNLAVWDALRPDPDALGKSLRGHLMACVWAIHDETEHTPELPDQTFTELCSWLAATAEYWNEPGHTWKRDNCRPCADGAAGVEGFVIHHILDAWRTLAALCRVQPDRVYRCPQCRAPMRLQEGGQWLLCDNAHTQTANLEQRYRYAPPQTVDWLTAEFGVTASRISTWAHRHKLKAARRDGRQPLYWPWDVLLLAHPDVADAIAEREKTQTG